MPQNLLPLLIHFHIPRTGGTTVGRMLKLKTGFWPPARLLHHSRTLGYYRIDGYEERLQKITNLPENMKSDVKLFEAHAGFGLHELLPQPSAYLTMFREPIDRAVSAYYYMQKKKVISSDCAIGDFLFKGNPQRVWWIDNAYVRYLAGDNGEIVNVKQGGCTQTMYETAAERLECKLAWVGLTERFDESMILLRRKFNWKHCFYVRSRSNPERKKVSEISVADKQVLTDNNQLDIKLYELAVRHFDDTIGNYGESFKQELDKFDAGNQRYASRMSMLDKIIKIRRRLRARKMVKDNE